MKHDTQICTRCHGMKIDIATKENYNKPVESCPKCNGEGFEVIITSRQFKEYQWLEKIADELEAKHIEVANLREDD